MENVINKEELKRAGEFIAVALKVCKRPEKDYTFVCPSCGGTAHVRMAAVNGHRHGYCDNCELYFME